MTRQLKQPTRGPSAPSQLYGYDSSASAWYALSCDSSGNLTTKHAIEFEVAGTPVNVQMFTASATATLVTATGTQRVHLHKAFCSVSATIAGTIALKLGDVTVGGIINPIPGGNHVLMSASPDYVNGSSGGSVVISFPAGQDVTVTLHYE